jgi:hypothetical protein
MKNMLWTIALIAALSFVFVACGPEDDPNESVTLYVDLLANGFWTDDTIGVDVPDIEGITYEWAKADNVGTALGTGSTFTPGTNGPGKYRVTVTAGEQTDYAEFVVAPAALKNTDNTWYMNRTATGNGSPNYNETVEITPTGFALKEFTTAGAPAEGSFTFTITDWVTQSVRPTFANNWPSTGFNSGFRVTGTGTATGDYTSLASVTSFYIFMGGNNNGQFVRSNGTAATSTITERYYEKTKVNSAWQ